MDNVKVRINLPYGIHVSDEVKALDGKYMEAILMFDKYIVVLDRESLFSCVVLADWVELL